MKNKPYHITEKLFIWPGDYANWYFLPITKKYGIEIKETFGSLAKGFGSLPVEVTIGKTIWHTSIFPDKHSGSYILPVKAKVRKAEQIQDGELVKFSIKLIP